MPAARTIGIGRGFLTACGSRSACRRADLAPRRHSQLCTAGTNAGSDQCRPPLSHLCVQLLRHILLFPEQLSAQCCLQVAGSKAKAVIDKVTRQSNAANAVRANVIFFLPLRRVVSSTIAVKATSSRRQRECCL